MLNRHIKSLHTRKKELFCKVDGCDYICGRSDHLKSHVRNRHKELYYKFYPNDEFKLKNLELPKLEIPKFEKKSFTELIKPNTDKRGQLQNNLIEQNNNLLKQLVEQNEKIDPELISNLLKLFPNVN